MKNSEFVSKITNTLKANNKDNHISRRFILKLGRDITTQLISQKWLDRTILLETNLYTTIPCFEFKKVESKDCPNIEFRRCSTLMKSKCKLPKLVFSRLGASVREIVSLDGSYRFVFLDKGQYQRNKSRQHSIKDEVYVYLDADNYLYIPDQEIYTVDLTILTPYIEDAYKCSSCKEGYCKDNWQEEFVCPDKLLSTVFSDTLQVLGMSKQIREDSNPNGIEGI